jgi:hypothetical protein
MTTLDTIKDICGSVNPRPKESEKTMEEHEYMTADSAENCHKILDWSFSPGVEIKIGAEWFDHFDGVRKGYKYRRPAPQKEVEVGCE